LNYSKKKEKNVSVIFWRSCQAQPPTQNSGALILSADGAKSVLGTGKEDGFPAFMAAVIQEER